MASLYERLDDKKSRDIRVLADFINIYCREHHRDEKRSPFESRDEKLAGVLKGKQVVLCRECGRLLSHGVAKLLLCPYDPKPTCKKCETHCYAPGYRERVREVMRFSGMYLVKRGRFDLLVHYFS